MNEALIIVASSCAGACIVWFFLKKGASTSSLAEPSDNSDEVVALKVKIADSSHNLSKAYLIEDEILQDKLRQKYVRTLDFLGVDRKISVSREISKMYEETYRGSINDALNYFSDKKIKGEFVICIDGSKDVS